MTEHEMGELSALRTEVRGMRDGLQQLRRAHRRLRRQTLAAGAFLLGMAGLGMVGVVAAAPASDYACSDQELYCFATGQPASAAQVNSNFGYVAATLLGVVGKIGDLTAGALLGAGQLVAGTTAVSTTDAGIFSQASGAGVRVVSNGGRLRFYTDGGESGIGTNPVMTLDTNDTAVINNGYVANGLTVRNLLTIKGQANLEANLSVDGSVTGKLAPSLSTYAVSEQANSAGKTVQCDSGDLLVSCSASEDPSGSEDDVDLSIDASNQSCTKGDNDPDYRFGIVCLDLLPFH